tara:strand:- start:429 stop:767 length:339 start_codon:yes stop_codon:yes gene_type:complete
MTKQKIKKVIKGLKKASKLHAKQAKTLQSIKMKKGGSVKLKKGMTAEEQKKRIEYEKKIQEIKKTTEERKIKKLYGKQKKIGSPKGKIKKGSQIKKFSSGGIATRGFGAVIK